MFRRRSIRLRPRRGHGAGLLIGRRAGILLVLAALAVGRTVIRSNYYVTDYSGAVSIMQGIQGSILGVPLHQPYSQGCLNTRNQLSVIPSGAAAASHDCRLMKPSDLAESARAQVAAGLPVGNAGARQLPTAAAGHRIAAAALSAGARPVPDPDPDARAAGRTPRRATDTSVPQEPSASPVTRACRRHRIAPTVTALSPPPPQPGTNCRTPE